MRNSDPRVRIVFVHKFNSNFSTPYLPCRQQVVTSNTGPILVFPRIQRFGSFDFSSLDKVFSRHVTGSANCKNSVVCFVVKYCPTSIVVRILHQYTSLSIDLVVEAFPLVPCTSAIIFSCAGISIEGVGVVINKFAGANSGSDCSANTGLPVLV